MRVLALDVGDERIGVAISDSEGFLARPVEVLLRRPGPSSFLRVTEIVAENQVGLLVVGLPLLPDGSEGKQVRSTQAYVAGLKAHLDTPIVYWDERDSTVRAAEIMAENGRSERRQRQEIDAVAAAVILQGYLDSESGGPAL